MTIAACALVALLSLTAPPPRAFAADPSSAPATQEPEFTLYQQLLDDYLRVMSAPGEPLETRFDYEEFYVLPNRDARLAAITSQLLAVALAEMKEPSRTAWAINTYNFLVLRTASQNLYERRMAQGKVEGRRAYVRRGYSSVNQMTIEGASFFEARVVQIEGVDYSLNAFERKFLFAGYDRTSGKAPPKALDPRVRCAIVPGARSSPPLSPRAYTGDSLQHQLDTAARMVLAHPGQLRWNAVALRLEISPMFHWYAAEFGGNPGLIAFIRRHAPAGITAEIDARKIKSIDAFMPWDWTLNQVPAAHRKPRIIDG